MARAFGARRSSTGEHRGWSRWGFALVLLGGLAGGCALIPSFDREDPTPEPESHLYTKARQLTFAGRRSGEGYFDTMGRQIVFQSEREPGNPFYQIYRMDLETGETRRVSPGHGKATCAWIHPDGERVLFASTHLDPESAARQEAEFETRASGTQRRYSWDYDPSYDLFVAEPDGRYTRLTRARGYDAEASFSPDGRWVAFSSNRHAFEGTIRPEERERLAENPQYFIDLYLLDTESGATRRLTTHSGYDGGAFFSPDGERVVWRRFSKDGARAEIHTIRLDGTDERVLTRLGVMSWAPFFHPSGDYLVFNTNLHGYANFELYLVDAEGRADPVRVTHSKGFDALASFSPDGRQLLWTRNRAAEGRSQLFLAEWDDTAARRALALPEATGASLDLSTTRAEIRAEDIETHVRALTDPRTQGRRAGTPGERTAARYLSHAFSAAGLEPDGDAGGWLHAFDFTAGVSLGEQNMLRMTGPDGDTTSLELDRDWRPLAFSRAGGIEQSGVVFAGYGLVVPAEGGLPAIDDYGDTDVRGRWVVVFRDVPQDLDDTRYRQLRRHAGLRYKAMLARDRGAVGLLVVSGPAGRFTRDLVPLGFDASLAGTSIATLSLSDDAAAKLLAGTGHDLPLLQATVDRRIAQPDAPPEIELPLVLDPVRVEARIDLRTERAEGVNVIGRLRVGAQSSAQTIVVGAHYDHLGRGEGSGSLADASETDKIHPGADDNASGTALVLELAQALTARHRAGVDLGDRDFVFAAWSGEELGLLGSNAWVAENVNPHTDEAGPVAYLNFDMVGRLREHLVVQGLGSSPDWAALLERAAVPVELSIHPQQDSYVPTDATSFYTEGVPVLSAFTGVHSDYHTPRDTADRLYVAGTVRVGSLFLRVAESLGRRAAPPTYRAQKTPSSGTGRAGFRVFLGTIPDYARTDVMGVLLSGVAPEGPAQQAGLQKGDLIVEAAGRRIENLYDYTFALEAMRVGEPIVLGVERDGRRLELEVVPASRDH